MAIGDPLGNVCIVTDTNNNTGGGSYPAASGSTSSSLLRGLRANDQEAWRRAARIYGPLVYRWAIRAGLRREDSLDVVQEVFRTVAARMAAFRRDRAGDTFRGWLWGITRNKVGDCLRRSRRQPQAMGGSSAKEIFSQLPAPSESESGSASDIPAIGALHLRALRLIQAEFEERTWRAFWRVVVEDARPADLAAELGISVNAIYLAKARVLRRLREELGEAED